MDTSRFSSDLDMWRRPELKSDENKEVPIFNVQGKGFIPLTTKVLLTAVSSIFTNWQLQLVQALTGSV